MSDPLSSDPLSPDPLLTRVAIVGAGPAGLSTAVALARRNPDWTGEITVLDPGGAWMDRWHRMFAALDIGHLRSPTVHHPDDDPWAFVDHVAGQSAATVAHGQFALPATAAFQEFCDALVGWHDLDEVIRPVAATGIAVGAPGAGAVLELADGTQLGAAHVVLATNPRRPVIPGWAAAARAADPRRVRLAHEVDLQHSLPARVLIVGGGLTGAQLAVGAFARGVDVHHVTRRALQVQPFDVEAGWLGPRYLDAFRACDDLAERRAMVASARPTGSMPGFAAKELRRAVRRGLHLHEAVAVLDVTAPPRGTDADAAGVAPVVAVTLADASVIEVEEVWLATGSRVDVLVDPLAAAVQRAAPIAIHDGLPAVDPACRWPGTDVFVVGAAAALQIGPGAGIMFGHRQAAARVAGALLPGRRCLPRAVASTHDRAATRRSTRRSG